jgi:hypothetical protein
MQSAFARGIREMRGRWRDLRDEVQTWQEQGSTGIAALLAGIWSREWRTIMNHMLISGAGGGTIDIFGAAGAPNLADLWDNLGQMHQQAQAAIGGNRAAEEARDRAELLKLEMQLAQLRERARVQARKGTWGNPFAGDRKPPPGMGDRIERARIDVVGTFSGAAAGGLGFGQTLMQRTATASEETRDEVRGLRRDVRQGGGLAVV